MDGQESGIAAAHGDLDWTVAKTQQALNMVAGRQVAIAGKIVMISTPRQRTTPIMQDVRVVP